MPKKTTRGYTHAGTMVLSVKGSTIKEQLAAAGAASVTHDDEGKLETFPLNADGIKALSFVGFKEFEISKLNKACQAALKKIVDSAMPTVVKLAESEGIDSALVKTVVQNQVANFNLLPEPDQKAYHRATCKYAAALVDKNVPVASTVEVSDALEI